MNNKKKLKKDILELCEMIKDFESMLSDFKKAGIEIIFRPDNRK